MSRKPLNHGKRFAGPGRMPVSFVQGTSLASPMKRRRPMTMEKRFLMSLRSARYKAQLRAPSKVKLSFLEADDA